MVVCNTLHSTEQSSLHINYGQKEAGSLDVELTANQEKTITYVWNTTDVAPGTYSISDHIDVVSGENQTSNNDIKAGSITIVEKANPSETPLMTTSLYVFTLVIVDFTTFSLLTYLKFRKVPQQQTLKTPLPIESQEPNGIVITSQVPQTPEENLVATKKQEVTFLSKMPITELLSLDKAKIAN